MDLRRLIDDFLTKVENALYTPYDLIQAQKDYEQIVYALDVIEKSMSERDMLNVTDKDLLIKQPTSQQPQPQQQQQPVTLEQLHQRAVVYKSTVDADFQKIAAAASVARAQAEL